MKGKLLKPYDIDMNHTVCAGAEIEIVDGCCGCNGCVYQCVMPDGTQKLLNSDDIEITDQKPYVDWENIRIKAAIAAMQTLCGCERFWSYQEEDIAKYSVRQADALIEELKKTIIIKDK